MSGTVACPLANDPLIVGLKLSHAGKTPPHLGRYTVLERFDEAHARQCPMTNLMYHRTLYLNSEDYKPTVLTSELVAK